jgi:hypothetical protein
MPKQGSRREAGSFGRQENGGVGSAIDLTGKSELLVSGKRLGSVMHQSSKLPRTVPDREALETKWLVRPHEWMVMIL